MSTWYGFWVPTLTERDPRDAPKRRITGGALTGSTWVANRVAISPRMPEGLFMGQIFGSMVGTGTVFLAEKGPRTRTSFMLAGGALGSLGGYGFVSQMVEVSPLRSMPILEPVYNGHALLTLPLSSPRRGNSLALKGAGLAADGSNSRISST